MRFWTRRPGSLTGANYQQTDWQYARLAHEGKKRAWGVEALSEGQDQVAPRERINVPGSELRREVGVDKT